ncbi:GFA family protein [Sphingomonas sabuli]|uniref:GFA family protein n=1 Tax=Sphingomonas sabuli TaxID=2764186 RepID=A0A7G9L115_9SPHN|nr:GFA family protein [Sphingomonas sabuli]QNM82314.1 GFA family protein [Sphingomonas sabuli]
MTHVASCRCGQLTATATGDPVRVSVCHCLNCKKRSGSMFAAQVRWPEDRVTIAGQSKSFPMTGDSGSHANFHFCPDCGTDVYYVTENDPDRLVAITMGTLDKPTAFTPFYSVYESRKPAWLTIAGEGIDHFD